MNAVDECVCVSHSSAQRNMEAVFQSYLGCNKEPLPNSVSTFLHSNSHIEVG
jgi:hypothetical protein